LRSRNFHQKYQESFPEEHNEEEGWLVRALFRSFNCFFIILQKIFSVVISPEAMLVNEHTGYGATFLAAK